MLVTAQYLVLFICSPIRRLALAIKATYHRVAFNAEPAMANKDLIKFEVSSGSDDEEIPGRSGISERALILLEEYFGYKKFKSDLQGKAVDTILKSKGLHDIPKQTIAMIALVYGILNDGTFGYVATCKCVV